MARFIILILIAIIALSYFGISIRHVVESPTGQDNFEFVWMQVKDGWEIITAVIAKLLAVIQNAAS